MRVNNSHPSWPVAGPNRQNGPATNPASFDGAFSAEWAPPAEHTKKDTHNIMKIDKVGRGKTAHLPLARLRAKTTKQQQSV